MNFRSFPRRVLIGLIRWAITRVGYIDHRWYMAIYVPFLKWLGYNLTGTPKYISGKARIDGTDPRLITLGQDVVISSDVRILTHDFSVARIDAAHRNLGMANVTSDLERNRVVGVSIGENSFIGAFSLLMPGTTIGRDCIIGAGAVVRGAIPDGSIVIGNPGSVIRSVYPDDRSE